MDGFGTGTHNYDQALGLRVTVIVKQMVLSSGELGKLIHHFLGDLRGGSVKGVDCFPSLEVNVRILGSAANYWAIWGECPATVGDDLFVFDEGAEDIIAY